VTKKTLVIGASLNPERYSYMAIRKLKFNNFPVVAMGLREGEIFGVPIEKPYSKFVDIHTITICIGPRNLPQFHDYILCLNPKRVIFNPGTEDPKFQQRLEQAGIEVVEGCTLIMISSNQY
jgi:hypothetical protein